MAYLKGFTNTDEDNSSSTSISLQIPSVEANDLIILTVCAKQTATTPVGYTAITANPSAISGQRTYVYYKISDGTETSEVVTFASGTRSTGIAMVYDDVDITTPIENSSTSFPWQSTTSPSTTSTTATSSDSLLVGIFGGGNYNGGLQTSVSPDYMMITSLFNNDSGSAFALRQLNSSGDTGTITLGAPNFGVARYALVIKNKTGGKTMPVLDGSFSTRHRMMGRFGTQGGNEPDFTMLGLSGVISQLNGIPVSSDAFTRNDFAGFSGTSSLRTSVKATSFQFTTVDALSWYGTYFTESTPLDARGKTLTATMALSFTGNVGNDGLAMILFSGSNWSAFNIPKAEISGNQAPASIFITESSTPMDSSGTLDFGAIDAIGFAFSNNGLNSGTRFMPVANICLLDEPVFTGATSDNPITPADLTPFFTQHPLTDGANIQGLGQNLIIEGYQIGNGLSSTHFNAATNSVEFPANKTKWNLGELDASIRIKASDSDSIKFDSSVFSTQTKQKFEIDAATSLSATYSFNAFSLIGFEVVWNSNVQCSSMAFINCDIIDGKSATFNNVVFDSSISTTSSLKIDGGTNIDNCTFTKGSETYAIELSGAGNYTMFDTTFSGYTTPLNVTATSGTLTIELSQGQAAPSYTTAGATVNFVLPQSTGTVSNIVPTSRIQIYNVTTDTEIYNDIVSGTTYTESYTAGSNYSNGDIVRVRLTCQSNTTAYDWFESSAVVDGGWSVRANQQVLQAYSQLGIDGSTVTEYTLDNSNVEIDLSDADGQTQKRRLVAWLFHATAYTAHGIREFFKSVILEDAANAYIDPSVSDLTVDNIGSTQVIFTDTDFRLYRKDGSTWVKFPSTGGYGIVADSQKVYVAETGVSGLTPSESSQLFSIPTTGGGATASEIRQEIDSNSTKLASIENTVSAIPTQTYTIPDYSSELSTLQTSVNAIPTSSAPTASEISTQVNSDIRSSLVTINEGIQKASKLIPHSDDLQN